MPALRSLRSALASDVLTCSRLPCELARRECPKCAPETRGILDVKRALAAAAADQDRFFQALENSDDGFAVVAEHFGRGIL